MILYNVTINIEDEFHERWMKWMKEVHIPDVMRIGIFSHYRFFRLLTSVEDNTGTNYAVQYFCENLEKFQEYELKYAKALREEVEKNFSGRYYAFRSLLEEVL
jgi:hypothetical protein